MDLFDTTAGMGGLVPAQIQATSLPIGINDVERQQPGFEAYGDAGAYRFRCDHCGQPYNILAISVFMCTSCDKLHPYREARGPCMIFGCNGSTRWEYDININGTPRTAPTDG